MISLIASIGLNNELGKCGDLIWKIPDDMKFFKSTTMGHIVVMGYNTYKSLPSTLKGRKMIVLSRNNNIDNVEVVRDYKEIIKRYENSIDEVFIIGGASIYKKYLEYAKIMYLTRINDICKNADTFFPKFDLNAWNDTILHQNEYNGIKYKIHKYIKKSN